MKRRTIAVLVLVVFFLVPGVFAQTSDAMDVEFSYSVMGGMFVHSYSPIEKAVWNDDRLEVTVLYLANCYATDVNGTAQLDGDTIRLFFAPVMPQDRMALCENTHRGLFVIRGLPRKNYKIVFGNTQITLDADASFETESPEAAMQRTAAAEIAQRDQEFERKFADYSRQIEGDPNGAAEAYYLRSFIQWRKGDREEAIADLSKALEINPSTYATNVHRFRAEIYCELEQYDKAWEDWDQIRAYYADPDFEERLIRNSGRQMAPEEETRGSFAVRGDLGGSFK